MELTRRLVKPGIIPDTPEGHALVKRIVAEADRATRTIDDLLELSRIEFADDAVLEDLSLEDVIRKVAKDDAKKGVFNNAAQVWNHTFYWNCLSPNGGGEPAGALGDAIDIVATHHQERRADDPDFHYMMGNIEAIEKRRALLLKRQ